MKTQLVIILTVISILTTGCVEQSAKYMTNQVPEVNIEPQTLLSDTDINIILPKTDQEGDVLTYRIETQPNNGQIEFRDGKVIYTPNNGYIGKDKFELIANDGVRDSNSIIIKVDVTSNPTKDGVSCDDNNPSTFSEYYINNICGNGVVDNQTCDDLNPLTGNEYYTSGVCGNGTLTPTCASEAIGSLVSWNGNDYEVVDNTSIKNITPDSKYSQICTTQVTSMYALFANKSTFNEELSNFDTLNVINMKSMFYNTGSFDQLLPNFNTLNVTNMSYMFQSADSFNQSLFNFNTSSVTDMSYMFSYTDNFNQDLSMITFNPGVNKTGYDEGASSWVLPRPIFQ